MTRSINLKPWEVREIINAASQGGRCSYIVKPFQESQPFPFGRPGDELSARYGVPISPRNSCHVAEDEEEVSCFKNLIFRVKQTHSGIPLRDAAVMIWRNRGSSDCDTMSDDELLKKYFGAFSSGWDQTFPEHKAETYPCVDMALVRGIRWSDE